MKYYFFTGAGLSQESGIPTFRDSENGTWENHNLNEVCNFLTYKENKELVFNFYSERKKSILLSQPNEAHYILANLQQKMGLDKVIIFTQNVDDLLEKAGCKDVIHLHGNIFEMKCYGCGLIWNIGDSMYEIEAKCPKCNCFRAIKPNIVFFNEIAPNYQKLNTLKKKITLADYLIAIGTSFEVIGKERVIPSKRFSSEKNIQINPIINRDEKYFGKNIQATASKGLTQLLDLGIFI